MGLTLLKNTINDKRVIGEIMLYEVFTWIYAACSVNVNMRRHTGGAISMGYSTIHGKALKQKINVKSSAEAELVGVSEYIPYNLWLIIFLE